MTTITPKLLIPRPTGGDPVDRAAYDAVVDAIETNAQGPRVLDQGGMAYHAEALGLIPTGTKFTNLTTTAASTTITDPDGGFTAAMDGLMLVLPYGGRLASAGVLHGGIGPIFTYTNATTGVLSIAPKYSLTGTTGWMVPNNTTLLNAALATVSAANSGRGGVLQLSAGIYGHGQLTLQPNVTIQGVGIDRTILVDRALTSACFYPITPLGRIANVSILDLTFEGSRVNFTAVTPTNVDGGRWRFKSNNKADGCNPISCTDIDLALTITNSRATFSATRTGGTGLWLYNGCRGMRGTVYVEDLEGAALMLDAGHALAVDPTVGTNATGRTAAACTDNRIAVSGRRVMRMAGTRYAEDGATLAAFSAAASALNLEGAQRNTVAVAIDGVGSALLVTGGETSGTAALVTITPDQSGNLNIAHGNVVDAWGKDIDGYAIVDQGGQHNTVRAVARNICRGTGITTGVFLQPSGAMSGTDQTNNPGYTGDGSFDTTDEDLWVDLLNDAGVGTYTNAVALNGHASTEVLKRNHVWGRLGNYTGAPTTLSGTAANRPMTGADRNLVEGANGDTARLTLSTPGGAGTVTLTDNDPIAFVDATAGAQTVALPTAVGRDARRVTVVKVDASVNAVTVDPSGAQTINGAATVVLAAQYDRVTAVSNGTNWIRVD